MRKSQLNLDLLNIEESLMFVGLISVEDIKDPTLITNKNREQTVVENIVRQLFKRVHGGLPEEYLDIPEPEKKQEPSKEHLYLIPLFYNLIKYAEMPSTLFGQQIRSSLLNTKLEKILFEKQSAYIHLPTDRIFRKSFALVSKIVNKYQPYIRHYVE